MYRLLGYCWKGILENNFQDFFAITFDHFIQGFEEQLKKKKENQKRKPGGKDNGSGTDDTATPPPPKRVMHPGEELKPRGFDRGLQAEKIIGATGK